jgi:hypothetical protein
MAVEKLLNREINIKDFHPMVEKPRLKVEQKYNELQKTGLYNYERNLWRSEKNENGTYYTSDQLIALLVEGLFDKKNARLHFKELKQSLYNDREKFWNYYRRRDSTPQSTICHAETQLLGVLVQGMFDSTEAKKEYNELKQTPLYSPDKKWLLWQTDNGDIEAYRTSPNQLLGIMTEALFNKGAAKQEYEALKKTSPYEEQQKNWTRGLRCTVTASYDQLLGVLVEGVFDKEKAKKIYEELKQSEFYDQKRGLWKIGQKVPFHYSKDQFVGILIEMMLGDNPEFTEKVKPVPEVRRF